MEIPPSAHYVSSSLACFSVIADRSVHTYCPSISIPVFHFLKSVLATLPRPVLFTSLSLSQSLSFELPKMYSLSKLALLPLALHLVHVRAACPAPLAAVDNNATVVAGDPKCPDG